MTAPQTYFVATDVIDLDGVRAYNPGDEVPASVVESRLLGGLVEERDRPVVTIDTPQVKVVDAPVPDEPPVVVSVVRRRAGSAMFRDGREYHWDTDGAAVSMPAAYADELLQYGGEFVREGEELPPEPDAAGGDVDLDSLKKGELVALAESRGLDSSGTVQELRDRLRAPAEGTADAEPAVNAEG